MTTFGDNPQQACADDDFPIIELLESLGIKGVTVNDSFKIKGRDGFIHAVVKIGNITHTTAHRFNSNGILEPIDAEKMTGEELSVIVKFLVYRNWRMRDIAELLNISYYKVCVACGAIKPVKR